MLLQCGHLSLLQACDFDLIGSPLGFVPSQLESSISSLKQAAVQQGAELGREHARAEAAAARIEQLSKEMEEVRAQLTGQKEDNATLSGKPRLACRPLLEGPAAVALR